MTKLERAIYAAENASEIDLDTRDKLLSVIYESNPVKSAYLKYKVKKTDAKYTKMIEAFENFRIKMSNKYGDAWIEKMNKSEEDAYIKAKALIDTYKDVVIGAHVIKESTLGPLAKTSIKMY